MSGGVFDGVAGNVVAVAQPHGHVDELHRIQIKNRLGFLVVAQLYVVAGEQQHIVDAQGISGQQIALQGDAVAVPAGQLINRLDALLLQGDTGGQRSQAHHGRLVVGHIDGVDPTLQIFGFLGTGGSMFLSRFTAPLIGADFAGNHKFAFIE
jgi:hypothetical protein